MKNIILFTIISLFSITVFSQDYSKIEKQVDSLFVRYNSDTPGVAVGVLKHGKFVLKKNYGSSNLEYDIPITSKTTFQIASVSKQFTAFAIYLLNEQRKLSFDDDIRYYIPEFPDYGQKITIKHLMAHTSGIRDQFSILTLSGWNMYDVMTSEQVLNLASRQKHLNFESGTRLAYSNTGYTFLALIVEKITNMSFNNFCQEFIFKPLEMNNTQFYDDYRQLIKNRAYSYELSNDAYVKKKLSYTHVGATNLVTTVEDLAKWSNNFRNPVVGTKELLDDFNKPSRLKNGDLAIWRIIGNDTLYHAKGQFIRDYRGIRILKHGGHDAGFRTFLARFPEEDLTIITLSNDEHYEIFARGLEIAEFYLGNKLKPKSTTTSTKQTNKILNMSPKFNLTNCIGKYYNDEVETFYGVKLINEKLYLNHKRHGLIPLEKQENGKFVADIQFYCEIEFVKENHKIVGFKVSNFGIDEILFKRI